MQKRRKQRLDSLLHEVIAEMIRHKIKNPKVHPLTTVTRVDVSPELDIAVVYISIMADDPLAQKETLAALKDSAKFIAQSAFKEVHMFQFPKLEFRIDESIAKVARMDSLFASIQKKKGDEEEKPTDDLPQEEN